MQTPDLDTLRHEADTLAALLAEFELDSMIDVHAHFMPQAVMDKVWSYFDQVGPHQTALADHLPFHRGRTARRTAHLRRPVLDLAGLPAQARHGRMAQLLGRSVRRLHAWLPAQRDLLPEPQAPTYVTEAIRSGARVFKAHLQVGDYPPTTHTWTGCGPSSKSLEPVVIHCGHDRHQADSPGQPAWNVSLHGSRT